MGSDITTRALRAPVSVEPGKRFEYSNVDAEILGIVLQRASGKRYARYLSERMWNRLGVGEAAVWLDREGGMAHTFCCLQTTARGWLAVGRSILDLGQVAGEQVVPAAWVLEMLKGSGTNPNFGLQIWLGNAGAVSAATTAQVLCGRSNPSRSWRGISRFSAAPADNAYTSFHHSS